MNNTPLNPHLRQTNVIASAFLVDESISFEQKWNHKGCQVCHENKRRGYIVNEKCQIQYNGECVVLTMNKALRNSGRSHYNLFYQLMDEVLKPALPDFTFHWESRTDGRFYITSKQGDWLYLYWSKDIYDCYYIGNASF